MKQITIALLLLTTILFVVQPVAAGEGSPDAPVDIRMAASPNWGNPGDQVTVSGSEAVPGQAVFVTLSPQADSATGAFVTEEVMPAADGTFSVELTIPADVPDGIYAIRAEQFSSGGDVLQYYWNAFIVGAGGPGPLLPPTGGVAQDGVANVYIVLSLVVLVTLVSKGLYFAGKGVINRG